MKNETKETYESISNDILELNSTLLKLFMSVGPETQELITELSGYLEYAIPKILEQYEDTISESEKLKFDDNNIKKSINIYVGERSVKDH